MARSDQQIAVNVSIHNRVADKYDARHGEIFNEVEQGRLQAGLARARDLIRTGGEPLRALDLGCGSGNLSRHLLQLGFEVVAADVSERFLQIVEQRFAGEPITTYRLNGRDLGGIPSQSLDMVAVYSVLHHIPDYLGAVAEAARVCRPGGVIFLDHEPTEDYWVGNPIFEQFRKEAQRVNWSKFLAPSNYYHKLVRIFNPRHTNEGDIHVWPDDHIEWASIVQLLAGRGFRVVAEEDYLLFRSTYREEVYRRYLGRCTDTRMMIFRNEGFSPERGPV
jgi:ubiquinone/menaquinone biosynthesis C-methylase UbiE